ncbi:acyl-CoA thioesterase [Gordonia hankookensis]|uniref:Thioesterase family protein n=1 Tax=Gordonia hankookensis TaxID=589403 RepID=A0ABR7W9J9_9ACTN|nr:acyl-CoA thioesterase domain-containing protein [Gordonia hankookensis]MBD1319480.1 thioesterase family protein [Gordonia hankookensis]
MATDWRELISVLDLRDCTPIGVGASDRSSATTGATSVPTASCYRGTNLSLPYRRLFGGQLLAQFVAAAGVASPEKTIRSIHANFLREGMVDEDVTYEVDHRHRGRSFDTLQISATQTDRLIAVATVAMHVADEGPDIQTIDPVPDLPGAEDEITVGLLPWEIRSLDDLDDPASAAPHHEMWMRTPPADDDRAYPCVAAYATDLTVIGTALRPLDGFSQGGNGTAFHSAVTSHTMWFHRPVRTDQWLLIRQDSPIIAGGRCYGRGDIITESGSLVASFAQEAVVRMAS